MSEKPSHSQDPWIERVIDNRYRITERIGHGGMGTVYKVVHTQIGKIAAMKLLHGNLASDKELLKRFHREAEAISRLNHPNIVQVFDFGRVESSAYLVMEYLKGEDLGTILRRDGPLDFHRCCRILMQVCDALAEAHEAKIIHRDLKPENVRVSRTKDGHDFVKVLDFGLAKMVEEEKELSITAQGNLVGTPYYMAPEMIKGEVLDHRCDIYSFGAMAYRMLTGENAFTAKTPVGVLTKHITDDLTPPSERAPERHISPAVDALVLKAMAKDREHRYQSALEAKAALLEVEASLPPPEGTPALHPRDSQISQVIAPNRRASDQELSDAEKKDLEFSPTGRIDESVASPVLSKEDMAFERRLRSGLVLKLLLLLPLLGALAFVVYWYGLRHGDIYAPPDEVEPNNTPDKATPLFRGKRVAGHIGQRVSATESDRDWYRLKVEGAGPQMLQARVSGVANMDITLELFDAAAGRITGIDSAGKGGGEVLANWVVDPGAYYLLLREVWLVDTPPTENVTDAYHLETRWQPYDRSWEIEPNDRPEKASPLRAGASLRGFLATVTDVDAIGVESAAGTLAGVVSGITGVDVVVEVTPSDGSRAILFDEEGVSAGERIEKIAADGKSPVRVVIRRKNNEKSATGAPAGLDVPYTLRVWITPGGK